MKLFSFFLLYYRVNVNHSQNPLLSSTHSQAHHHYQDNNSFSSNTTLFVHHNRSQPRPLPSSLSSPWLTSTNPRSGFGAIPLRASHHRHECPRPTPLRFTTKAAALRRCRHTCSTLELDSWPSSGFGATRPRVSLDTHNCNPSHPELRRLAVLSSASTDPAATQNLGLCSSILLSNSDCLWVIVVNLLLFLLLTYICAKF